MALGLGGIVASGLAGAVSGAGQGMNDVGVEEQKQAALALQQQQLATLNQQTHAVNLQADAASAQQNALPTAQAQANAAAAVQPTVSATKAADQAAMTPSDAAKAGAIAQAQAQGKVNVEGTVYKEGDIVTKTNPDGSTSTTHYDKTAAPNPKDLNGYYDAITAKINAETDALQSGNKSGKMNLPDIIHSDIDGKPVLIDKKSGLLGTVVPGQDAVPAQTHWVGANDPGKPATPWHVEWTDAKGQTVDFDARYPDLQRIANGKAAAGSGAPTVSSTPNPAPPAPGPQAAGGAAAGKTVVRTGTDAQGNRVAQFSDGSIGPAP